MRHKKTSVAQESQEALLVCLGVQAVPGKTHIVARGDHLRGQWMIPSKQRYSLKDIAAEYIKD